MAKEKINVVRIDTDPAKKSLKDLRKELMEIRNEMVNLEEGSDAFLEMAQKGGELQHQIQEIGESIRGASSDFGDMVGNVTNVMAGITGAFQAVAGGLQAMGMESEALDKTIAKMQGLMAVTQGLSAIDDGIKSFGKLTKAIQGSSAAMKVFKAISNPVALAAVAAVIVTIGAAWNKWGEKIRESLPWLDEFIKKFDGTAAAEAERLAEAQRKFNEELAISNEEVAEILKNRKWNAITKEAQDQIKFLEDEIKIYENKVKNIVKQQETASDAEWNRLNEIGKGYLEQIRLWKNEIEDYYNNPKYQLSNQTDQDPTPVIPKTPEQIAAEQLAKSNELLDIKLEKLKHNGETEKKNLEDEIKIEQERLALYKKGSLEYERIESRIYNLKQKSADLDTEITEESLNAQAEKAKYELEGEELIKKQIEIETQRLSLIDAESAEYWNQMAVIKALNAELTALGETTDGNLDKRKEYLRSVADEYLIIEKRELNTPKEYKRVLEEIDEARKLDLISEKEHVQAKARVQEVYTRNVISQTSQVVSATSSMLTGLLDGLASQQDTTNKEGFEKSKKLQIASATIQMLTGITTALAGAFTTKTGPWDIALAAIQAASIAASGAMNINKIKQTKFDGASGAATNISGSASSAMIIPPVQYSNAVTGASIDGNIKDSRVYVLESDIRQTGQRVETQETENIY